jgi:hypothetical protein
MKQYREGQIKKVENILCDKVKITKYYAFKDQKLYNLGWYNAKKIW